MADTATYVDRIVRLRITLSDTKPTIWRTVEVPLTTSLKGLHEIIQAAMPFLDYHLFQFTVAGQRYGIPDPEFDGPETRHAKSTKLGKVLEGGVVRFAYVYDFGDHWEHTVTVESVGAADPAVSYPRFVEGQRRAPPEDVGGVQGFKEFLAVIAKPRHREHKSTIVWCGGGFDPSTPDLETIQARMGKLARRREVGRMGFARSRGQVQ